MIMTEAGGLPPTEPGILAKQQSLYIHTTVGGMNYDLWRSVGKKKNNTFTLAADNKKPNRYNNNHYK